MLEVGSLLQWFSCVNCIFRKNTHKKTPDKIAYQIFLSKLAKNVYSSNISLSISLLNENSSCFICSKLSSIYLLIFCWLLEAKLGYGWNVSLRNGHSPFKKKSVPLPSTITFVVQLKMLDEVLRFILLMGNETF